MKFAVLMDPLDAIRIETDTSFAMIEEAWRRGWEVFHFEPKDLYLKDGLAMATGRPVRADTKSPRGYQLLAPQALHLGEIDAIAVRKDPPFDMEYIYATYILETAKMQGAFVFNDPEGIRNANEKYSATHFSKHMVSTLVTKNCAQIRAFIEEHGHVILKPMDWMGGTAIFHLRTDDPNNETVLDTFVEKPSRTVMVQRYIPEIETAGDKRIFLFHGEPVEESYARFAKSPGLPANAARGGSARPSTLNAHDRAICNDLKPYLKKNGLWFVGIDIIGPYLTEINVTSATGIRIVQKFFDVNPLERFFDLLSAECEKR